MNENKKSNNTQFRYIEGNNNNLTNANDSYNTDNYINTNNINYYINNFDFSFPEVNPMENSNNRTLLKSKVGKRIKIWAYAVDEYKKVPSENIVRYTIINLHSDNVYIADHIQLQIPYELYYKHHNGEDIRHKIIMVDGLVKDYETSYGYKQSIYANKLTVSYANNMDIHKDYLKITESINEKQTKEVLNKYKSLSSKERFDLMLKYIDELNGILPRMPKDFISNYIINQYTINYDPDSLNNKSLDMLKNDAISLMEITFLIIALINNISHGVNNIQLVFKYINWVINSMQGLKEENVVNNSDLRTLPFSGDSIEKTDFEKFCDHHNLNPNRAYRFILNRNFNFGGGVINKIDASEKAIEVLYNDLILKKEKYNNNGGDELCSLYNK